MCFKFPRLFELKIDSELVIGLIKNVLLGYTPKNSDKK